MDAWAHSDSIDLICKDKWSETPDTVSFTLSSAENDLCFQFKPGQFCSLGFDLGDKVEYRAYSISSLPGTNALRFTVKRVEGGLVSNHIVDQLKVGTRVTALKPVGQFNSVDCQPKLKVTMVSAGCGITPVMTMVKVWLEQGDDIDIDFIHMARDSRNTIYFAELEQLARAHSNFHLKLLLKNSDGTSYPQGRLDKEWLVKLSADIKERTVYLCGPISFMQDIEAYLAELDFDMNHFFEESFTPVSETEDDSTDTEQSGVVNVTVPDFGVSLEVDKGSLLVDALEKGGVPVIIACRSGMCGSCKVKVKVGEVERTSTETLTDADIENGYVLACSCKLKSDAEVSLS